LGDGRLAFSLPQVCREFGLAEEGVLVSEIEKFSTNQNEKTPPKGKPSRQMKKADWLIVAGVMFIPTALFVLFGVDALVDYWMHRPSFATDAVHAFLWVAIAISAGLITTGVLMRKRSSN
jgi:hypothetical protein